MVLVLFLALSIGAFFSQNSNPTSSTVAEAPASTDGGDTVTPSTPVTPVSTTTVSVKTRKEVPLAPELFELNTVDDSAANTVLSANQGTNMVVYRASRTSGTDYRLEAAEGVTADFTYDASGDPIVRDLTFTIMVKGIQYTAFAQSVKIQQIGTHVYLVGQLTDLIDLNGLVYSGNVLSKALIQLDFDASDLTRSGTFTLVKAS
jgi:hypothetical protein